MWNLLLQVIAGAAGIWISGRFVPNVDFAGPWQTLLLAGAILGALNFFAKPILKTITLPIRIITLNLFTFAINMFLVWLIDVAFQEFTIQGLIALFWTSIIIWLLGFILAKWLPGSKKKN